MKETFVFPGRRNYGVVLLFGIAFLLYLSRINSALFFQGGDNAAYFALARSLAQGTGFTSIYTWPMEPHTKYPFFFPLMLAGVILLFGENVLMMKFLIILCAALIPAVVVLLVRRVEGELFALGVGVLTATVPVTLDYSCALLSDIPFAAFVLLTLLFCELSLRQDSVKKPFYLLTILFLLMAYFTRSAGITLVPAVAAAYLLVSPVRPRLRPNLLRAAGVVASFAPASILWALRCYVVTEGRGESYWKEFFLEDPSRQDSPLIGITGLLARVVSHGKDYLLDLGRKVGPFTASLGREEALLVGLIIFLIVLGGLSWSLVRRRGAPEWFTLFYLLLLLVWGFYDDRFLIPLLPFLLYYFLKGIEGTTLLAARLMPALNKPFLSPLLITTTAVIFLFSNARSDVQLIKQGRVLRKLPGVEVNPYFRIVAFNAPMDRMLKTALYLRDHSPPDAVVMARKNTLVYLASHRPCVGGPFASEPAEFIADLERRKVSYLLIDEIYEENERYFLPAVKAFPHRFRLVYQLGDTRNLIYEFIRFP